MAHTIPQASRDYDTTRIVERPDGFYWHDEKESDKVFGPFPDPTRSHRRIWNTTLNRIMNLGETLEQAEEEIGISDWIDPETGQPGEVFIPS